MKDITITKFGLRIEGRMVQPGSRIRLDADAPAHFARFAVPTAEVGEKKVFEVATPKPQPEPEPQGDDELEAARAEYAELFGSRPHGRMSIETIREKINAELEG